MSRSLNRIEILGNAGGDPEVRTTPNGVKVATFSVATSREWKGASGEKQEKTEWHKCVVWGTSKGDGLAGVVEKYVAKGDKIYVAGRVEYRHYENKDKQTVYVTEINVTDVLLLGGLKADNDPKPSKTAHGSSDFPDASEDDDDLPF